MEVDFLQLIKDRMPCLDENEVVCKLLDYFLKENYSSDLFMLADDRIEFKDDTDITIYNYDNIEIVKTNEEIGVEEDIRFNIIDNNSFDIFYCNYDVNGNKPLVKSFNLSVFNNKLSSAVISEWDFSREMELLLPFIANILASINPNMDHYEEIKQLIDKCSDTNIIEHYKILSVDDKKITTDEDDMLLEEPHDKEIFDVLDGFFDFSNDAYSKSNQAMYESLLTLEDSIENINAPKERQYILLNNRKIKRDDNE